MVVTIFIQYHTHYGQEIFLKVYPSKNRTAISHQVDLHYYNEQYWKATLNTGELDIKSKFIFSASVADKNNGQEYEIIPVKTIDLKDKKKDITLFEQVPQHNDSQVLVQSKAYPILNQPKQRPKTHRKSPKNVTHLFQVVAPALQPQYSVCLSGSDKQFGHWSETEALILDYKKNKWTGEFNLSKTLFPAEYKLAIFDHEAGKVVAYENGDNRVLFGAAGNDNLVICNLNALFPKFNWRGAGLNIPVFSLRSDKDWGIGDFSLLKPLTDWSVMTGIRMLQLLPINDTTATKTFKDSYPYSSISPFALHPLYLNIPQLAKAIGYEFPKEMLQKIEILNQKTELDYDGVLAVKLTAAKSIYQLEKNSFKDDFAWIDFFNLNRHWLVPYAVFCYLRDQNGTADFSQWKQFNRYDEQPVEEFANIGTKQYDEICFYYFIQYHLHLQLNDAVEYAHQKGIIFKGDLPIGVGRHSVDTWMYPQLFHMEMQAGAPPDYYSATGQNWSFPTYNWEAMAKDGYKWWRQRMEHLGNYFDAIRIDHVLGFFRIWSIPVANKTGTLGIFQPAISIADTLFKENGISIDKQRFCKPFINKEIIETHFKDKADWVTHTFLDNGSFKSTFNTQASIAAFFEKNPEHKNLEQALQFLLTNVLLIEDEEQSNHYHFRIGMHQTESFKSLPDFDRSVLDRLYNDYFFTLQNKMWEAEGIKKLNALKDTTSMLICAEDLGMVPEFMDRVLHQMGMLSLKVQRMPKEAGELFSRPAQAPYLTVVTTATHDMSTLREWWENEKDNIPYFFNSILGHFGTAPRFCEPWIASDIIKQHLESPAMWAVFLFQDLIAIDGNLRSNDISKERINNPSNPDHYWNYRMHLPLERLLHNTDFNQKMLELIKRSGR